MVSSAPLLQFPPARRCICDPSDTPSPRRLLSPACSSSPSSPPLPAPALHLLHHLHLKAAPLLIFSSLLCALLAPLQKCWSSLPHSADLLDARFLMLAVLLAFGALQIWLHRRQQRGSRDPKTWPILGSQLEASRNYDRLLDWTTSFFRDDHRTVKMSFLSRRSYYTVDPANVEHVLKTNFQNYPKGSESHDRLFDLLGSGILNTDGSTWKMHRKIGSFEFSVKKLRHLSSVVYKINALKLVDAISVSSCQGVDMQELLLDMTFRSISEVVLGHDFDQSAGDRTAGVSIAAALDNAQEMMARRYIYPWWRIQRLLNIGSERVFHEDIMKFRSFLDDIIDRRQLQLREQTERTSIEEPQDLLSRFLSRNKWDSSTEIKTGQGQTDKEMVRDALLSFVLAGRDTTASTLSWFIYCMATHPHEQEKIYQELLKLENDTILQSPSTTHNAVAKHAAVESSIELDRMEDCLAGHKTSSNGRMREFADRLTYDNLQSSSLQYLHSAIAETLRLYPAVPRDGKVALEDDVLPDGTRLKAGDQVAYIPYAMGRMEFLWGADALAYRPDRWLRNGVFESQSPFKFTAFQAGPRMCLGKDAAYLQIKITAALLLRFFHFELVPGHPVEYRMMNIMTMKHGLRVNITAR